jgi:microcystin degradation protein MlrC
VTGTVRRVAGGKIELDYNHQRSVDMGQTVVFDVGPVTLLISELRGVAGNLPGAYRAFGVEPAEYKMAVLKTASNFQYFAPLTSQVIRVDTRGPGQSDILTLPWSRIPRPIYPLDPVEDWRGAPQAADARKNVA